MLGEAPPAGLPETEAHFLHKTGLPGSVHAQYVRCGKPGCRCARGERHGPYWRRYWREGGATRSAYVRLDAADAVMADVERWQEVHWSKRRFKRWLRDYSSMMDTVIDYLEGLHDKVLEEVVRRG